MAIQAFSAAGRSLNGKVALITGAASGIGEYTAKLFTEHGAKVIIADIQDDLGHSLCKELGPTAQFVHCDVTNEAQVQNAVDYTMAQHGKLDIMYNNAGTVDPLEPNIINIKQTDFERIIKVNLVGPFLGTKHAARVMKPAGQGSIINTASTCSVLGGMGPHGYTSSKHGVVGLMKSSAVELGKYGIRVNCVSPHYVATPLAMDFLKVEDEAFDKFYSNLKGSRCRVDDVAKVVVFLGSDDSKFISGHNLVVDGGFTIMNAASNMFE